MDLAEIIRQVLDSLGLLFVRDRHIQIAGELSPEQREASRGLQGATFQSFRRRNIPAAIDGAELLLKGHASVLRKWFNQVDRSKGGLSCADRSRYSPRAKRCVFASRPWERGVFTTFDVV